MDRLNVAAVGNLPIVESSYLDWKLSVATSIKHPAYWAVLMWMYKFQNYDSFIFRKAWTLW